MTKHVVIEMRTGRGAEHTPETAVQLFATIPDLKNKLMDRISGTNERVSFEILVQHQTIYFIAFIPERLLDYFASLVQSSYPEVMLTLLDEDPVLQFLPDTADNDEASFYDKQIDEYSYGSLAFKNPEYLPMKDYQDFKDIDPLATILSTLSKAGPTDQILIQFTIKPNGENWKNKGYSLVKPKEGQEAHPKKELIAKKLKNRAHLVAIRVIAGSHSSGRSQLLLETIAAAFQSISQGEGNQLQLKKPHFLKRKFVRGIKERKVELGSPIHLSLDELATLYHLPNKKLRHISNIAWGKQLLGEPPENLPIVTADTPDEIKKDINVYARTEYKNRETVYGIKRYDRRKHMYVIGKTGTGKSTLLANMAINDLKNDEGMCVIDPHGDLVETLLDYIPSHRINDVVVFDPADPERTVKINLFEGKNVVHRELIASGIVSIFYKLYGYSWGPRLEHILRNSLLTLLTAEKSRMSDIVDLLSNKNFRDKIVDEIDDPILKNFWTNEFNKMQDRQRSEAIAPILNKVGQFVSSPLVRHVVNAHESSFSIEDIMDEGKIILVNLSQGKLGEDNATLLGAMLITKIQLAAMARVHIEEEKRRDFYLYVDEFQNFATDSFVKILSEARKYRLNLILANQYIAQIPEEVQKAIFGNCGSIMSFIMGADDARSFSSEYGGSYTEEDLVSLSRYQIINKLSIDNVTSKAFPARTLNLATSSNKNREKVIKVSRERYAREREEEKVLTRTEEKERRKEREAQMEAEGGNRQQDGGDRRQDSGGQRGRSQGGYNQNRGGYNRSQDNRQRNYNRDDGDRRGSYNRSSNDSRSTSSNRSSSDNRQGSSSRSSTDRRGPSSRSSNRSSQSRDTNQDRKPVDNRSNQSNRPTRPAPQRDKAPDNKRQDSSDKSDNQNSKSNSTKENQKTE